MSSRSDRAPRKGAEALSRQGPPYPVTPDGRYFVVRGRLWRCSNPALNPEERDRLTKELMRTRRDVARAKAKGGAPLADARARVDAAKRALGERGFPWWTDGAPDYNRRLAISTPYADWFLGLQPRTGHDLTLNSGT